MTPFILAAFGIFGFCLGVLLVFKANAGILFLSACAGLVLLSSLDPVVVTTAGAVVPGEGEAYVRLITVLAAVGFSGLLYKGAIRHGHLLVHVIIAILTGAMLLLILPSSTGVSWLIDATNDTIWHVVNDYRALIVASGFALSLFTTMIKKKERKKRA